MGEAPDPSCSAQNVCPEQSPDACVLPGCPLSSASPAPPPCPPQRNHSTSSSDSLLELPSHFLKRDAEQHSVKLAVPHVHQSHNWDCGLACVLMVMQAFNVSTHDLSTLSQVCETKSIWTIDLAHLLKFFGFEVMFCTVTLGANPDYASETFYRDHISKDEERVGRLFDEAEEKGICLHKLSLTALHLKNAVLSGQYLVIVLIDKRKLNAAIKSCQVLCGIQIPVMVTSYTGHYVVICGFDVMNKEYIICDPASTTGPMSLPEEVLEEARKSFGTDEDILFVAHKLHTCQHSTLAADSSYRTRSNARRHRRHAACSCLRACCCDSSSLVNPHNSTGSVRQPVPLVSATSTGSDTTRLK